MMSELWIKLCSWEVMKDDDGNAIQSNQTPIAKKKKKLWFLNHTVRFPIVVNSIDLRICTKHLIIKTAVMPVTSALPPPRNRASCFYFYTKKLFLIGTHQLALDSGGDDDISGRREIDSFKYFYVIFKAGIVSMRNCAASWAMRPVAWQGAWKPPQRLTRTSLLLWAHSLE